jgi:hypothetical protein
VLSGPAAAACCATRTAGTAAPGSCPRRPQYGVSGAKRPRHPLTLTLPLMLALIRRTLTPAPAPLTAQAERFRGTAAGWQPIGGPRPAAAAARLAALIGRIDPAATLRVRTLAA